jgi:hypothetical protein
MRTITKWFNRNTQETEEPVQKTEIFFIERRKRTLPVRFDRRRAHKSMISL